MKNLVTLFVIFFSLFLASCSDVTDNSMLTNPVIEKSIVPGSETASPLYPYPYLYGFTEIKAIKYYTPEGQNSVEFLIANYEVAFSQLYVVVTFNQDMASRTYYIDQINQNSFKVDGIDANNLKAVEVYGVLASGTSEGIAPLVNNSALYEVTVNEWKVDESKIVIESAGPWPSSLKFVFAEIITKENNFFVFLQRPYSNNFVIPEYGKYGVESVRLFGHHTITERVLAVD